VGLVLVIAVMWLFLLVMAVAILRTAARADRAAERGRSEERPRRPASDARRVARTVLTVAALPLAAAAASTPDADAQGCRGAHSGSAAPGATLCLINVERRARGLAPLSANATLARAARRHATDMVLHAYFSHVTPGGLTFTDRLRNVGYLRRGCSWSAGEALAWGTGAEMTPASRVAAWMESPPHRALLLGRGFREAGLGIVPGVPSDRAAGLTYAGEFGRRRC
jgi:uncharacterized protein YkwD